MASIEQYHVMDPPTSEGVYRRIVKAFENRQPTFSLLLLSTREVPPPQEQEVNVALRNFMPQVDGTTLVDGTWTSSEGAQPSIVIEIGKPHSEEPATAHLVTATPPTLDACA